MFVSQSMTRKVITIDKDADIYEAKDKMVKHRIRHLPVVGRNNLFAAFETFKPEVIIVSAGFDAHVDDDMSDIKLSTEGFSWIMEKIVKMAGSYSNDRLISVLEGGYSLKRLPELAKNHVKILLNS